MRLVVLFASVTAIAERRCHVVAVDVDTLAFGCPREMLPSDVRGHVARVIDQEKRAVQIPVWRALAAQQQAGHVGGVKSFSVDEAIDVLDFGLASTTKGGDGAQEVYLRAVHFDRVRPPTALRFRH
jgi:hypothetical protein